jgi:hypothetical protein
MKSKTKIAKKTAAARNAKAPQGLSLLLSLIDSGIHEDAAYALARRSVGELQDWREGRPKLTAQEAVGRLFPSLNEPAADSTVLECGILVGASIAWLLMTDLNGGGR